MNRIVISSDRLPVLAGCNFCMANESFFHADRTLNFHVLLYVVSGCIYVTEDEVDYEVHAGEVLFLRSGIRHYGKKEIPKGTSWYFTHFYLEEPAKQSMYLQEQQMLAPFDPFCFQMELPKHLSEMEQSKSMKLLTELVDSLHSGNAMRKLDNEVSDYQAVYPMTVWNANARLFEILTEIAIGNQPVEQKQSLSDRIAAYLEQHIVEKFSADALEKQFFLSYKYMAAVFRQEKQMTLHQYHTRARMTQACQLLCTTMKSIGEISEELGYHDMLYFSRCFHQTTGMSPTEYRRQQTQNY